MKELAGKAEEIEAAYAALTEAQQALVQDYAKLTDIQALAALYAKDLDLLKQWASEDKAAYPDLEEKLAGLSAQAQEKLGNCTRQEELAPVLDGYCADVVRMLLADVGFAAGTTTMGELDEAAEKLERTRRALNGLTEAQKALLEKNSEQTLEAAEELLAVYRKAAETVEAWAAEDAASYPQIAEAVQTLAEAAKTELLACTDKDGAVLALGRYCANIAGALIDDLAFTSGETTMAEVKENALKTARAAYDALTEEQKALVPEEKDGGAGSCGEAACGLPQGGGRSEGAARKGSGKISCAGRPHRRAGRCRRRGAWRLHLAGGHAEGHGPLLRAGCRPSH